MAANSTEPCLYFVRAWRNQRVTEWIPLPNVFQEHLIRSRELQTATHGLTYSGTAPSFWTNNSAYQSNMMGAGNATPPQTYAILKLPISLVTNLTERQALDLVRQIEPHVARNLIWSSSDLHSLARINHLPTNENGAQGFYQKGAAFFRELKQHEAANNPADTLGRKFGLGSRQAVQPAPAAVSPPPAPPPAKPRPASAPASPAPAAAAPAGHRPSRTFSLHKRLGMKGVHPDPGSLKQLKRIWDAQKGGNAPEPEAPAQTTKTDTPAND